MLRGIYASASGMVAGASTQRIVSDNIANVNTPGHRARHATLSPFGTLFLQRTEGAASGGSRVGHTNAGARISGVHTSDEMGRLHPTGRPSDLGLDGPGFFVLEGDGGILLTRNGSFTVDGDGHLTLSGGHRLRSEAGLLRVGDGPFAVEGDGTVRSGDEVLGRIVVANPDPAALREDQSGHFRTDGPLDAAGDPADTAVLQGYLELSNADMVEEMTRLMAVQRVYQANHTAFAVQDRTLDEALRLPEGV
ncbi:MAG: flagellar hook basal-body protein [Bacillota bacterium]